MGAKFFFMATVERGLEDFCMSDLVKNFGVVPENIRRAGKIFFWGEEDKIYLINFLARSINRLYIILKQTMFDTLSDIVKAVKGIEWNKYIRRGQTFAIKAKRTGKHNFTSIDIAREVGSAIRETMMSICGEKPRVNLKNPDVSVLVEVSYNNLIIGIDTTGRSLHMRGYRVFSHPFAIKTTIAYAMIVMSEWNRNLSLLDPTCGGATIPIEAVLYTKKIPHLTFRNDFAFKRLLFLDKSIEKSIRKKVLEEIRWDLELEIFAIDKNKKFLEGAKRNIEKSNTARNIRLIHGDATRLHEIFEPGGIDTVVHNPPYHGFSLRELYTKILESELKIVRKGGKIVVITPKRWFWKILEDYGLKYEYVPIIREQNYVTYINIIRL